MTAITKFCFTEESWQNVGEKENTSRCFLADYSVFYSPIISFTVPSIVRCGTLDQLAKPTFRSRYTHTTFTEQSEGPMDTIASSGTYLAVKLPTALVSQLSLRLLFLLLTTTIPSTARVQYVNKYKPTDSNIKDCVIANKMLSLFYMDHTLWGLSSPLTFRRAW